MNEVDGWETGSKPQRKLRLALNCAGGKALMEAVGVTSVSAAKDFS